MGARKRIAVLGAGGQARDVAWLISQIDARAPSYEVVGFVVTDLSRVGPYDSRDRIVGDYNWIETHQKELDALAIGIGNPGVRMRITNELERSFPRLEWPSLVHPSVHLDFETAKIGRGVAVCAGVVGTVNVVLEDFVHINPTCTLGHEAHIGRACVVNHAASISGGVRIGEGSLVGTGARVLQYLEIGAGATVGAGAVVTKNVPPGVTVVGVPARPLEKAR